MALTWNWKEKIGTAKFNNYGKEIETNIYECNGLAVFLYEWNENGEELYKMYTFFVDKEHMQNCLGITKGYENIYADSLKSLKLKQCKTALTLIQGFSKAKFSNDITITIQPELPF